VKIIPLEDERDKVLVINKVALYAIRLFEYNFQTNKLIELKRFAKNKIGFPTLESASEKVSEVIEKKKLKR
jgi:hypothetical protein